jgi:hypothetical protein
MVRKSSLAIGLALAVLWWLGLSQDRSATILWFDAVAAVIAFGIAGIVVDDTSEHPARAAGPALLGLGLGLLWVIGMTRHQPAWANWANFLLAVACLAVAIAAVGSRYHVPAHVRR